MELEHAEQALLDAMQRASNAEKELNRLKSLRRSRGPKAVKKAARRKK